jgi:hypothetical protein
MTEEDHDHELTERVLDAVLWLRTCDASEPLYEILRERFELTRDEAITALLAAAFPGPGPHDYAAVWEAMAGPGYTSPPSRGSWADRVGRRPR